MLHSDWHIHSKYSYDATLPLDTIIQQAHKQGLRRVGVTDHVNFNDSGFLNDLYSSAKNVGEASAKDPILILGVELNPFAQVQFDYTVKNGGSREGFVPPEQDKPYDIALAVTKQELIELGVRYTVGAAHARLDIGDKSKCDDVPNIIKEWHREQMFLACDERVTILGHPWWHGKNIWNEDFSVIPHSMNLELAAVLKENGKYVECNYGMICHPGRSDKFRHQYAEFMRELFEFGIPVTFGTDQHHEYPDERKNLEKYLYDAGFREGDFSEIAEEDLW